VSAIATGSGLERFVSCRASSTLPRIWHESSGHATRGTEIHAHLERVAGGMSPAESLACVEEEHRPACSAVDLDALSPELGLSSEVSLAYDTANGTGRVLGVGLGRDYSSITEHEVPMTIDVLGVAPDRVVVADYKTGYGPVTPTRNNWQLIGAALTAARAFDRDVADAQLIHLRDNRSPRRDRATFDALDLAGAAERLRTTTERAHADRAAASRGEHVEPTEGSWCRYCPCEWSCPAKVGAIRLALGEHDNLPVTAADAGVLWARIEAAETAMKKIKGALIALASHEPLLLRLEEDGSETWLGRHVRRSHEKLDPAVTLDEAAAVLGIDDGDLAQFTREVAGLDVTKASIERACKARGVSVAKTMDTILSRVRARGGAVRGTKETVGIYNGNNKD